MRPTASRRSCDKKGHRTHRPTLDEAHTYRDRLGDTVHDRSYGDRRGGPTRLLASRALAVLAPPHSTPPRVRGEEGHTAQQDAARSRVEASHLVGFHHQLEGHRRDEHAPAAITMAITRWATPA
jgi:hypothetical protein